YITSLKVNPAGNTIITGALCAGDGTIGLFDIRTCGAINHLSVGSGFEHSCINPKSLTFGYLDEKPIDTDLMKFLALCPSALSWYLEFASTFSTFLAPFLRPTLSLNESKGSMTPRKSHLCSTMALPSPWPYYPLPCICIPFSAIGRSTSVAL
ncbi:hypothetical protein BHM03_00039163, partial [Ensete ventricosum]